MRCPVCRRSTTKKGNPFRPFCSERCKLIDLDSWLAERYRVQDAGGPAPPGGAKVRAVGEDTRD